MSDVYLTCAVGADSGALLYLTERPKILMTLRKEHNIAGKIGDNVLFLAHRHDIDIEGACEAALVSLINATK